MMTKYIFTNTPLPTSDIFDHSVISNVYPYSAANIADVQIQSVFGLSQVPDPINAPLGDATLLIANTNVNGELYTEYMEPSNYANVKLFQAQGATARKVRDGLLAQTDWTQGKDIPDAISAKWTEYRQALRDITSQQGFPNSIQWPQMPE